MARHHRQLVDRSTAATTDVENGGGLFNRDMTQSPVGQFGMMPIHVPQNEPAKQPGRLTALPDHFVHRAHRFVLRRGRCFFETERMINLPEPLASNGVFEWATAAASNAFTSGRFNRLADSSRMNRV